MKLIIINRHNTDDIDKVTGSKIKVSQRWP